MTAPVLDVPRPGRPETFSAPWRPVRPGTAYARRRRAGIAAGTWRGQVDPGPARAKVAELRAWGLSAEAIAELAGLPAATVRPLVWDFPSQADRTAILGETERAILAARYDPRRLDPTRLVPAVGTVRRLQALAVMGWDVTTMAGMVGVTVSAMSRWRKSTQVQAGTAVTVLDLYAKLARSQGQSEIARRRALAAGWASPAAWDDDALDDPTAVPEMGEARGTVDIADAVHLIGGGDTIETAARRLGVTEPYLVAYTRRHGTPEQVSVVTGAASRMGEIRLSLAERVVRP